jgi:hypothetical protein
MIVFDTFGGCGFFGQWPIRGGFCLIRYLMADEAGQGGAFPDNYDCAASYFCQHF